MTSLLRVDDVDVLSLDFSKVSFDDDVDVKEYETIEKESNVQKESQGQTGNDFVILDDGKPLSDSEDEGPLVAPRNKASGDGRAHTPQKISKITRWRKKRDCYPNSYNAIGTTTSFLACWPLFRKMVLQAANFSAA